MLYVTTRNTDDAYTAHRALTNDRGPDGGSFVPFRLPVFDSEALKKLADKTFNQTVADILNMFFSLGLNGLDLDLYVGRNINRLVTMNHRIVVAELWHNLGGDLAYIEDVLCRRLSEAVKKEISKDWPVIASRIAVVFGIYGQMLQEGLLRPGESVDFSVRDDAFMTPITLWYCRSMGLPINRIICTSYENSNLWDFINRGTIGAVGTDAQLRSCVERLLFSTLGCNAATQFHRAVNEERGFSVSDEELTLLSKGLFCSVAGKDRAQTVINSLYRTNAYIIDSQAALCYGGLQDYRAKTGESGLTVILAENTPLNCVEEISAATGLDTQTIKNHINQA